MSLCVALFFSSRRRHTRCALVTGVQTCALPILACAEDSNGSVPEEWNNVAFLANPITSTINCVRIVRNPDGSVTAKLLPDLLYYEDDWFRPANIESGPHGFLYIADRSSDVQTSQLQLLMRISYAVSCVKINIPHLHTHTLTF